MDSRWKFHRETKLNSQYLSEIFCKLYISDIQFMTANNYNNQNFLKSTKVYKLFADGLVDVRKVFIKIDSRFELDKFSNKWPPFRKHLVHLKTIESIDSLITFNCAMDFRAFPFDKQFCKITLYVDGYYKSDGMKFPTIFL